MLKKQKGGWFCGRRDCLCYRNKEYSHFSRKNDVKRIQDEKKEREKAMTIDEVEKWAKTLQLIEAENKLKASLSGEMRETKAREIAEFYFKTKRHLKNEEELMKKKREIERNQDFEYLKNLTKLYYNTTEKIAQTPPSSQEADQTPRAWNLVTIKRCVVTKEEFQYYGTIEAVLTRKKFPAKAPDNGDLLISWFDLNTGVAYYELCRPQDEKEMLKYVREQFQRGVRGEGEERMISLEE